MASSAPAPTLLNSLPARPPTPPREANHEPDVSLKSLLGRPLAVPFDPRLSLQTPPSAANSPVASSGASSGDLSTAAGSNSGATIRTRKKVEWSAHTEYKEPAPPSAPPSASAPSSAASKPVKGILKPSSSPNPLASTLGAELDGPESQLNISEMLDSTIRQLAGADRDSRLDAYMMLARALKTSNNLPDRVALQDKMSLFMQFIQRDITAKTESGALDSSLINHALSLLATFLHFHAIASTITSEFAVFIIDHSIRSFEDPSLPKDVVRHLMQVVAFQNFSPKVMTSDRVGRLVTSLNRIEGHLKGKSIVMCRIQIYKTLVKQSRMHMATHSDWLQDMFTDMLSVVKDIRNKAISLGMEVGYALRSDKQLLRRASEILQTANDEQTYIEFYIQSLNEMMKDRQKSSAVPQIWGVVILFLRCPLERWQYYGPWLTLAQSAFNSADSLTKQEANYAWNRYVHLSLQDSKLSPKALGTLIQPLMSQLRRKPSPRQPEEGVKLRRTVIGGICNLYYYTFRPGSDKYVPDVVWDVAVQPVMAQFISLDGKPDLSGDCIMQASKILVGLLDVRTPRVWREDRIMDLPPVKSDELPSIDPKWVRRNSDRVFQAVGPIFEKKFLDLANKDSLTYRLWQALVGSVAVASAKDIKVSEDTAKFFACTLGLLSRIWSQAPFSGDTGLNSKFLPSVRNFIEILVGALGILPFTEKKLSMTVANTFEPIVTPSHRSDRSEKHTGIVRMPLHHLFSMLCSIPPGGTDDDDLSEFLQAVFEPFFLGKSTKARIELAQELLRLSPRAALSPFGPWVLAAQNMALPLETSSDASESSPANNDKLLGPEYREIVSLLERGLTSHPNLPSHHWFALFNLLSKHLGQEFGDAGRSQVLIEPLAKILLQTTCLHNTTRPTATALQAMQALFEAAKLPRDRQAMDAARQRLWGSSVIAPRSGPFEPFNNLYKLGNQGMGLLYEQFSEYGLAVEAASFIEVLTEFLKRCLSQTDVTKTLSQLQDGICLWLRDEGAQLQLSDESPLSQSVRLLWEQICTNLAGNGRLDRDQLDQIEPLLTAAFRSKDNLIMNKAAEAWNAIFKDEENVECSDSLKSVLSSLRSKVDLELPGAGQDAGDFGAQVPSFPATQNNQSVAALSSTSTSQHVHQQPRRIGAARDAKRKRRPDATPEPAQIKSAKRSSTPRLRHDNSQIEFTTIASSSPLQGESQHLTDRQKEIRERQKENAALYSDLRSSSPARDAEVLPAHGATSPGGSHDRQQEATPERPASYEELISSTPTPRRGQVLHMDDNEPPSSPPEPRPYPLLSEIRSRSRTSSSLDGWELSSPPGSPVTSHQQVVLDAELPHLVLTDDSTQPKANASALEEIGPPADETTSMEVIPSSAPALEKDAGGEQLSASLSTPEPPRPRDRPTIPLGNGRLPRGTRAQETPKSNEEEFVDARSNPEQSSPISSRDAAKVIAAGDSKDISFALSDGDESNLMKFIVELESRRNDMPLEEVHSTPSDKTDGDEPILDCITVLSDSPVRPKRWKRSSKRSSSPVALSNPAQEVGESSQPETRKRKRGGAGQTVGRRSKRQSLGRQESSNVGDGVPQPGQQVSSPALAEKRSDLSARTRSSARKQSGKLDSGSQELGTDVVESDRVEGGETDEELMSQLFSESKAASQSQSRSQSPRQVGLTDAPDVIEDSMDTGRADEMEGTSQAAEPDMGAGDGAGDQMTTIMERLRGGMDELSKASLSRDDVHKIEDFLMDVKRELYEAGRRGRQG